MQQKKWAEAAEQFKRARELAKDYTATTMHSRYVLAMYRANKWLMVYQETGESRREATFDQLVSLLTEAKQVKELRALLEARRAQGQDSANVLLADAFVRLFDNQPADAGPLFEQAYQLAPSNQQRGFLNRFVILAEKLGHGLPAYDACPDRMAAFTMLADRFVLQKQDKELEALLQRHRSTADGALRNYEAELHMLRGEYPHAEQLFAADCAMNPSNWRPRSGLFRARLKLGKVADTYREFPEAFESLLFQCVSEKNAAQLDALLTLHREQEPDDPNFPAWELELRWLRQDYAGCVKLVQEQRSGVFALPRHRWKGDAYLVRSLVRLNRPKEAVEEADRIRQRNGYHVLIVLASAAAGDPKKTIEVVQQLGARQSFIQSCYKDEDLAPILTGNRFKEFRERFPVPAERAEY